MNNIIMAVINNDTFGFSKDVTFGNKNLDFIRVS